VEGRGGIAHLAQDLATIQPRTLMEQAHGLPSEGWPSSVDLDACGAKTPPKLNPADSRSD
jgi:hypothetical protein